MRLNAKQLRTSVPDPNIIKKIKKNPIYIILDNVLDTYNVGAIFRLADAVAAEKIYLCGETLTPPNHRIKKASINTTGWVDWEYASTTLEAVSHLKKKWEVRGEKRDIDVRSKKEEIKKSHISSWYLTSHFSHLTSIHIVVVEQSEKSIPLSQFKPEFPLAIVVGNETYGVSKEVLDVADTIVELPMFGVNKSLNVMVSLGIVLYKIVEYLEV